MVLELFRDLVDMAFKMFNGKSFYDRQKYQLLAAATIRSPKKTDGALRTLPRFWKGRALGKTAQVSPAARAQPCWVDRLLFRLR